MTLSRPPTMILTCSPLPPPPLLPESAVELAASLAQAVSEVRASSPAAANAGYRAVMRMRIHVLVKGWEAVRGRSRGGWARGGSAVGIRRLPAEDAALGEGEQSFGEEGDDGEDDHRGVHT